MSACYLRCTAYHALPLKTENVWAEITCGRVVGSEPPTTGRLSNSTEIGAPPSSHSSATTTTAAAAASAILTTSDGAPSAEQNPVSSVPVVVANAVVLWVDYADADDGLPNTLSTGPDFTRLQVLSATATPGVEATAGGPTAWSQGVRFFERPLVMRPSVKNGAVRAGLQQDVKPIARIDVSLDVLGGGLQVDVVVV